MSMRGGGAKDSGRVRAAKRLAQAAALGGGGLGLIGAMLYGVLSAEAEYAKRLIGPMRYYPTRGDGLYGRYSGHPITLAMIGDSSAAGYGTSSPDETPGVLLASGLSELAQRPVRLVDVSKTGAKSVDLAAQVDAALQAGPHVAAILIGVNDVKAQVPPSASVRQLDIAVRRLRAANCEVVVGTCPDLGVVPPIMPPLRQVARTWSQRLAAAQTITVVEAGGRTVSMGSLLSEAFRTNPSMWGPDNFHPSVTGYAAASAALLPSVAAAVGVGMESFTHPESFRGEAVLPIAEAAVQAARTAGTEVAAAQVAGNERGPRGRWVQLRHRRRHPKPEVDRIEEPTEPPIPVGN
ncbi:lysophospholipase L1-like esterase [Kribbella voronezhensis]|uniref:Lysophospholipase L1-like esterase n=1 Tax=Kribbella voronezhensis TaxID=2512212 RepID=A0A4R7TI89_9ACTN|nr:SGNH/GDSL hydrolase family protein [Kribbella voronezhensis]TDU91376.1 lysophospholipase L1-like esterase [Kribbella voronezhensis]